MLNLLQGARELTQEALTAATRFEGPVVARALERLVALNYAIKVAGEEKALYRVLARPLGE